MTTKPQNTTESTIADSVNWDGVQVRHIRRNEYGLWLPLADESKLAEAIGAVWQAGYQAHDIRVVGKGWALYAEMFIEVNQ